MATQQLMFDILASSKGVDKAFDEVVASADTMAGRLGAAGSKATAKLFDPKTAIAAGTIAGGAMMSGLHTAIDMDSVTSQMTAGLNLAGPAAEAAGSAAGELYAQGYGESFEHVAAAVGATVSSIAGMSDASQTEIETMSGKVLDLANAFDLDVGQAAQIAGQMISTGLAKDGAEAADLLTATLSKVPVALRGDVVDAIDEYGPMFAQLGITGGQAMTMLADASAQGAYGIDKTGDAFKELTIRAADGSTATADAMKTIGLDAEEMASMMALGGKDANIALNDIAKGLDGVEDPALKAQTAIALFGTPLEDLGTENIPAFIDSILNSQEALGTVEGSAAALGEKLHSGPGAAFTELKRLAEASLGSLGEQMLPILTPILEGLQQFAPIIAPAVIALGALAVVIGIVNAAMAIHNAVMLMNPTTWIVLGIIALIAAITALVMNWDSVVAFLTQIWGGFVNWITEIMNGFGAWWTGLWVGFALWIVNLWAGFTAGLSGLWAGFVAWIQGVVGGFVAFLVNGFQAAVSGAIAIWSALGGFFAGLWSGIVNGVAGMIGGIGGFFAGLPGQIMGFFAGAGSWLYNAGRNIVDGLLGGIRSLAGTIGNFFLDLLPGWIVKPFKLALGINSPSRVFDGFGGNLVEGVIGGVGRMQGRLDDRMANLVTVPDLPAFGGGDGALYGAGSGTGRTGIDRTTPGLHIENLNVSEASAGSWQGMGNQILQAAQVQAPRVFVG